MKQRVSLAGGRISHRPSSAKTRGSATRSHRSSEAPTRPTADRVTVAGRATCASPISANECLPRARLRAARTSASPKRHEPLLHRPKVTLRSPQSPKRHEARGRANRFSTSTKVIAHPGGFAPTSLAPDIPCRDCQPWRSQRENENATGWYRPPPRRLRNALDREA